MSLSEKTFSHCLGYIKSNYLRVVQFHHLLGNDISLILNISSVLSLERSDSHPHEIEAGFMEELVPPTSGIYLICYEGLYFVM